MRTSGVQAKHRRCADSELSSALQNFAKAKRGSCGAEAAGLARNLAEAEAAANAAARDAGAARRRCSDLDHQNQMLHAQFLAAREEAADMRARYRCGSPDICSTQSLT